MYVFLVLCDIIVDYFDMKKKKTKKTLDKCIERIVSECSETARGRFCLRRKYIMLSVSNTSFLILHDDF